MHGVDLHPPPTDWVPPNCLLEVDDITKEWTYTDKFDLIHLRMMMGSFTDAQTEEFYRRAYKHLKPGGWIEQIEVSVVPGCDDNTIPPGSAIERWGYVWSSSVAYRANTMQPYLY